jgi:hypothetical protein
VSGFEKNDFYERPSITTNVRFEVRNGYLPEEHKRKAVNLLNGLTGTKKATVTKGCFSKIMTCVT